MCGRECKCVRRTADVRLTAVMCASVKSEIQKYEITFQFNQYFLSNKEISSLSMSPRMERAGGEVHQMMIKTSNVFT